MPLAAGWQRFKRALLQARRAFAQVACTVTLSHDPEPLDPSNPALWWVRCRRCGLVYLE